MAKEESSIKLVFISFYLMLAKIVHEILDKRLFLRYSISSNYHRKQRNLYLLVASRPASHYLFPE